MFRSSSRVALSLALTLAVAALVRSPAFAAVQIGAAAPPFSIANARGGGKLTAARFRGKPLYLNFFASWCGPCNDEAPAVKGFAAKYRSKGLAVVGIDELESADKALAFAKKYGWTFPIGLDDGTLTQTIGSPGLPVHLFIDRRGNVAAVRFGEMEPAEIEAAIRQIVR